MGATLRCFIIYYVVANNALIDASGIGSKPPPTRPCKIAMFAVFVATAPSSSAVTAALASVPAFFASAIESVTSVASFAKVTFASAIFTVVTEFSANSVAVTLPATIVAEIS